MNTTHSIHVCFFLLFSIAIDTNFSRADWWEHPHDKWYVKDDWKAAKVDEFVKTIPLQNLATGGWIVIWGEQGIHLNVNGVDVMNHVDKGLIYDADLSAYVQNATEIRFRGGPAAIVAEGEILDEQGLCYPFASGCNWITPVTTDIPLPPADNAYRPGDTGGVFHTAHNARLMYYNDEERGKAEISKNLARIDKLRQQSIFLLRRFRSVEEILGFDQTTLSRRAERYAIDLMQEAESILNSVAVPAQKQGEYAQSIAMAREAAVLLSTAELAVTAAREVETIERQEHHLVACIQLIKEAGLAIADRIRDFEEIRNLLSAARREASIDDWGNVHKCTEAAQDKLSLLNEYLSAVWGAPIGKPDEFPEDRFGWLNAWPLMGNDPSRWEFTVVNPAADWIDLRGVWSFRLDPANSGVQKGWHQSDVLLRNWHEIMVPGPWERQNVLDGNDYSPWDCPYPLNDPRSDNKPYNGYAWYRREMLIPSRWAGRHIVLHIGKIANWARIFVNGTAIDPPQMEHVACTIPNELFKPGEINTIALQIYNHNNFGGILQGPVSLAVDDYQPEFMITPCPMAWVSESTVETPNDVEHAVFYSSSMTPTVVFTSDQPAMQLWGWDAKGYTRPETLSFMSTDGLKRVKLNTANQTVDVGRMAESWLLLSGGFSPRRSMALKKSSPVLLIFEQRPVSIQWINNELDFYQLSIVFERSNSKILILPFTTDENPTAEICREWAARLRSVPIQCSELYSLDKKDLLGAFFLKYHYFDIPDFANAPMERIAPVPQLLSYAVKYNFPGLQIPEVVTSGYSSEYTPFRYRPSSDALRYIAPLVDKSKLLKGVGELFAKREPKWNSRGGLTEQQMFDDWKEWGFDHCRYAFAWNADWDIPLQKGVGGPIDDDPALWERMDSLVQEMTGRGMQAMLCYFFNEDQPQPESKNLVRNSSRYWRMHPEARENVYELWRRIAERYANEPDDMIAYDFLNEPAYMDRDDWNQIVKDLTRIVRLVDKKHLIVIEAGDGWSQPEWFLWLEPTGDPNTIYSFHHYGKHWGYQYDEYYPGYQRNHEREIQTLLEAILFGIKNNVPLYCGEFGVSMISPGEDHLVWLDDYLRTFERFGIGWNWWNWSGSDIYRTGLRAGEEISPNLQILRKWIDRKKQ
ncbi:MAG: hypothetical protein C4527_26680 [Candidatus Omnitrophota bacterium]|jgi:aryl-phospho-beta-D-glucosidase BglC (GH1 family)|nr:MAG: hypothetical protein C4527_26680 [Candidatus Omnitrophota bacterium]